MLLNKFYSVISVSFLALFVTNILSKYIYEFFKRESSVGFMFLKDKKNL